MATLIRPIIAEPDPDGSEERERTRHLAQRYRCEFIDLREQRIDPELMRSIPAELMFRYTFVPLEAHNGSIAVALSDPSRLAMTDELALLPRQKTANSRCHCNTDKRHAQARRAIPNACWTKLQLDSPDKPKDQEDQEEISRSITSQAIKLSAPWFAWSTR